VGVHTRAVFLTALLIYFLALSSESVIHRSDSSHQLIKSPRLYPNTFFFSLRDQRLLLEHLTTIPRARLPTLASKSNIHTLYQTAHRHSPSGTSHRHGRSTLIKSSRDQNRAIESNYYPSPSSCKCTKSPKPQSIVDLRASRRQAGPPIEKCLVE
jgi:hypothetical protein